MNFSVVVPLFNEEKNINLLAEEIIFNLQDLKYNFELILVNDCSDDKTLDIIKHLKIKFPKIINILHNKKNLGQSKSIYSGISNSKYDVIVTLDGDGQNNPKDIPKLLKEYFSNDELFLVGGIRKKRKDSSIKIVSSKIANKFRNYILKDNCLDTGCSLKVFNKNIFLSFPFFDGIHRFLPALFAGYQKRTKFLDVDHRSRKFGKSNYGTFKRLYKGIIDIFRVMQIIRRYKKN